MTCSTQLYVHPLSHNVWYTLVSLSQSAEQAIIYFIMTTIDLLIYVGVTSSFTFFLQLYFSNCNYFGISLSRLGQCERVTHNVDNENVVHEIWQNIFLKLTKHFCSDSCKIWNKHDIQRKFKENLTSAPVFYLDKHIQWQHQIQDFHQNALQGTYRCFRSV